MNTTTETIQLALLALLAGVALPLLVQLFLTARALQRAALGLDRRLDKTLGDLSQVAVNLRDSTTPGNATTALIAALGPALLAGLTAFRSSVAARPSSGAGDGPRQQAAEEG